MAEEFDDDFINSIDNAGAQGLDSDFIGAVDKNFAPDVSTGEGRNALSAEPTDMSRNWSTPHEWMNDLLGGGGEYAAAAGYALKHGGLHDWGDFGRAFPEGLKLIREQRAKFTDRHPNIAQVAQILGPIPATIAATALGQEYALGPLASRLGPIGNFLMGTAGRGGSGLPSFLLRQGSRAASGAIEGTEAGLLASQVPEMKDRGELASQAGTGAAVGAVLNPLLKGAASPFANLITQKMGQTAQSAVNQGINIRPGQIPGAPSVTKLLDKISTGEGANASQREQWTRALSRTMGADEDVLDAETIQRAKRRTGLAMDSIAGRTDADATNLINDTHNIATDPNLLGAASHDEIRQIHNLRTTIDNAIVNGNFRLSGDAYQQLTRKDSLLDRLMHGNSSTTREAARDFREALDSTVEGSLAPQDQGTWRNLRQQYKNATVLSWAKEEGKGEVDPSKLLAYVKRVYKNYRNTGAGDLGDLAEAGMHILPSVPKENAATTMEHFVRHAAPAGIGGVLGAGGEALLSHDPNILLMGLAAGLGTAGVTKAANAVAQSQTLRNLLLNNAIRRRPSMPSTAIPLVTNLLNQGITNPLTNSREAQ